MTNKIEDEIESESNLLHVDEPLGVFLEVRETREEDLYHVHEGVLCRLPQQLWDRKTFSKTGSSQNKAVYTFPHWQSCSGTVPICRISLVCERVTSEIEIYLILVNKNAREMDQCSGISSCAGISAVWMRSILMSARGGAADNSPKSIGSHG